MRHYSTLVCATTVLTAILVITGETASVTHRIFKGRNTRTNEFPFVTWIEYQGTLVCSGSLIGEEWVLTSARCIENGTLTDYQISVGDTLVSNKNDGQLFFEPDTFFVHPDYDSTTLENAVALIRLPIAVNTDQKNIGLVPELRSTSLDDIITNRNTCVITGFGETTEGTPAKRKNKLTVRIVEDSECSGISNYNDSVHMCFQSKRKDSKNRACFGDEGAPITCEVDDQDVLMGFSLEGGCENLIMPALEMPPHLSWIQQIMDQNSYERCLNLPDVTNGSYVLDGSAVVNGNASLKCDDGLSRTSKDTTITCQEGGNWTDVLAVCGCGNPPSPFQGDFVADGQYENAVDTTATLVCNSGFATNVTDKSITCLPSGNWTATNATCLKTCGEAPEVDHGSFDCCTGNHFVGETAVLRCDEGYIRSTRKDDKATIECKPSGQWSAASNIRCNKACEALPEVLNGTFEVETYDLVVGDSVTLMCDAGFLRSVVDDVDATIACDGNGTWTSMAATCLRSCGTPPTPSNGTFNLVSSTLVNNTAVLECDGGFLRSTAEDSDATITCGSDGQWTTTSATCIKGCGNVTSVDNGRLVANGTYVGDEAILNCNYGYTPSSNSRSDLKITCEITSSWTTVSAYCVRTCFDPPAVVNGSFIADSGLLLNDTAVMSCDYGFVRSATNDSDATITCEDNGNWTTTSSYCIRTCFDPPVVVNGSFIADSGLLLDDTAVMSCDYGFVRSATNDSDATITCEDTGNWTTTSSNCIRTCFDPPAAVNGSFNASGLLLNDAAVLGCDYGFVRSVSNDSDASITCEDTGNWTTTAANCIRTCFDPPVAVNGSFNASGLLLNDAAVLNCDYGFVRSVSNDSDATITCEDTGNWTTTAANCIRTCFNPPAAVNGSFNASGLLLNDAAVLGCDYGFVRSVSNDSDASITCEDTGNWTTTAANCIRTCFDPPAAVNGSFNASGLLLDDAAVLGCDYGFVRSVSNDSDATITCEETGNWTTTAAHCIRTCFDPPAAVNGSFNASGLLLDDTAVLGCDYGFVRSVSNDSDATITCEETGNWTTTAAHCIRTCFDPPVAVNGSFNASGLLLNDAAVLNCDYGFVRSVSNDSDATITCEDTGNWTTTAANCIRTCFDPPAVVNGTFNASGLLLNDMAVMSCDYGFVRSVSNDSDATITCEDTGNWTTTAAHCIRTCFDPLAVLNGTFNASGLLLNDTAVMACDYGFVRSATNDSDATITCEDTGNWTTTPSYCIRTCFDPPAAVNGSFNASGLLLDDTAVLGCDYGFVRSVSNDSDATITCEDTGNWTTTAANCIRTCFDPPVVVNGTFNASGLLLNDMAVMSCDYGFVRSVSNDSDATITCEETGNWTTTAAHCIRTCFDPPVAVNGSFNASGLLLDDTAVLGCDYGFVRSVSNDSDATITCEDTGNWTTTAANCIRTCFDPPAALNGSFIADGLLLNDTAVLSCDELYVRSTTIDSEATITCQSNGNWTTTSAYCIRTCGDRPEVDNGIIGVNRTYIVNDTAELVCNTGYTRSTAFIAEASVTCQENGNWTSPTAYCVQSCSSAGTSFMVGFFRNAQDLGNPFLYGTTSEPASITISIPKYNYLNTVEITKLVSLSIPDDLGGSGGNVENKGIQISSNTSISLFLHHNRVRSAEGTIILPESCAKTEHLLITHNETSLAASLASSQSVTLALEDNTDVVIVEKSGVTVSTTINKYDLIHHTATDLSGTLVTASKNVVVYAGHTCANVPDLNVGRCDYIIEQMPPVTSLRRAYLLTYQKPRPHFSVRVVAAYDDTEVYFWNADGTLIRTVQLQGTDDHFSTYLDSVTISITSTRDILVAQYAHGLQSDRLDLGDPSYVVISSLTQFLNEYTPLIDGKIYTSHYLALIVKEDDDVTGLRLDGSALTSQDYEYAYVPGVGNFTVFHQEIVATTQITPLLNHINSTTVFGAMQYGFGDKMGYAFMAGRNTPAYF